MNYPIWNLPGSGLLIAGMSVLHVFISHFAVGGGLFLVWTERKARREGDAALLDYVKGLSRFFILLTLVLGAITGVGIWFTIALVHPSGTSSLINTFVWGWAIEWTFFITEIAAAMVYYYGWDRMDGRTHMKVGWIYFWAAWLSLVVINGILTYMLTPGAWVFTRGFWAGIFNPTYFPSLVTRTLVCMGIAGMYALFVAAWLRDATLKEKVARYASAWILPMAVALPLVLWWYLTAAAGAGVPVGTILGSEGQGAGAAIVNALTLGGDSGYPMAKRGVLVAVVGSGLLFLATLYIVLLRRRRYGRVLTFAILILGLLSMGGGEWTREDLRKPFVISRFMFTNGVRLPAPDGIPAPPAEIVPPEDRFTVPALNRSGVLAASPWDRAPEPFLAGEGALAALDPDARLATEEAAGREVFKLLCFSCHTVDGYNAIQPLVAGQGAASLETIVGRLAWMEDRSGQAVDWADWFQPGAELRTWRERRMPPFVGTDAERRALSVYLARLGGAAPEDLMAAPAGDARALFEEQCSICHAPEADFPMAEVIRGRGAEDLFQALDRLEELNENMMPFEGTDAERRALAEHLAALGG
jgi:mono/diheme cytochrome c family protein